MSADLRAQFIRFCVGAGILTFGEFQTKAGRLSPYFFNAGMFNDGLSLARLAEFYCQTLLEAERTGRLEFDMLYGPAYKGIALASATAVEMSRADRKIPFAFNRKERKDHGEGGLLIGSPVQGRVLIIDDVISAGTSVRESVNLIRANGATPAGVLVALDRQERGGNAETIAEKSAVQEIEQDLGIPVFSIASLSDLLYVLEQDNSDEKGTTRREAVAAYRARYGVTATGH